MPQLYVISSFRKTLFVELAVTELESQGVARESIFAIPLEKARAERKIMDSIYKADGISLLDGAAIMGTILSVLGVIYGFVLAWGPVIWGLIGFLAGAVLGFIPDFLLGRKRGAKNNTGNGDAEVILMVNCRTDQVDMVERTLRDHFPLGVARLTR